MIYIILEKYYLCFNVFSLILSYLILPFFSGYSKSGYFEKKKKIFDAIFYHYIKLTIALTVIIVAVIIYIIYKKEILEFYGEYKFFLN